MCTYSHTPFHADSGWPQRPLSLVAWLRLDYVVKGIKKVEAEKGVASCTGLPITPTISRNCKRFGPRHHYTVHVFERKMLWAACCLGFFFFFLLLRTDEMTVPSDSTYNPAVHLSVADTAVDKTNPHLWWHCESKPL